jgi:voltage-gated sodium channel
MHYIRTLVESDGFRSAILFLIVLNAFAMGLEATPAAADNYATWLEWVFIVSQVVFVVEIVLRLLAAPRAEFFRDSWNSFDFIVVALSLIPALGEFALAARVFRIMRVLRIVSVSDVLLGTVLRKEGSAKPVLLSLLLAVLTSYVFALIGFHVFGDFHPGWESFARSTATLFGMVSPEGFAAVADAGAGALAFCAAFYLVLVSIAANLVRRLRHGSPGSAQ